MNHEPILEPLLRSPYPCITPGRHVYNHRGRWWEWPIAPDRIAERCANTGGAGKHPQPQVRCTLRRVWKRKARIPWQRSIAGYFRGPE